MIELEDFLDELEHLPREIMDGCNSLSEMDLHIKQSMDHIKNEIDTLFSNSNRMKPEDVDANFKEIMNKGEKSLEESDRKIKLSCNMKTLITKYINKLDNDIYNCKIELEARNSGICIAIEKNYLNSESEDETNDKEEKNISECLPREHDTNFKKDGISEQKLNNEFNYTINEESTSPQYNKNAANVQKAVQSDHKLNIILASSSAIGASTFQNKCDDIRIFHVSNLDIEGVKSKVPLTGHISPILGVSPLKNEEISSIKNAVDFVINGEETAVEEQHGNLTMPIKEKSDDQIDADEQLYCSCNQVSYGKMVACDNKKCPQEWFHYECVRISEKPKGKWYCPRCSRNMKKRAKYRR